MLKYVPVDGVDLCWLSKNATKNTPDREKESEKTSLEQKKAKKGKKKTN